MPQVEMGQGVYTSIAMIMAEELDADFARLTLEHAPPDEACKLITNFGQAETNMIRYVEKHSADCGIPPQIADQLKVGHKNTEGLQSKVCAVAKQVQQRGPAGPSLSEVLGSSASVPEATVSRKGGSTFDTMNGNVLAR